MTGTIDSVAIADGDIVTIGPWLTTRDAEKWIGAVYIVDEVAVHAIAVFAIFGKGIGVRAFPYVCSVILP